MGQDLDLQCFVCLGEYLGINLSPNRVNCLRLISAHYWIGMIGNIVCMIWCISSIVISPSGMTLYAMFMT